MSDAVIMAGITSLTTVLTVVITGIINSRSNRKQNKQIVEKVDDYHKEVNGNMGKLIATTKELGERVGAEQNQAKTDAKPQDQK